MLTNDGAELWTVGINGLREVLPGTEGFAITSNDNAAYSGIISRLFQGRLNA